MMIINGIEFDLSEEEERFVTYAFGKIENGNLVIEIDDPLWKRLDHISPLILFPQRLGLVPSNIPWGNAMKQFRFCCRTAIVSEAVILLRHGWTLHVELLPTSTLSSSEKVLFVQKDMVEKISDAAIGLHLLSKDTTAAKALLLANIPQVCDELSMDGVDGINQNATVHFSNTYGRGGAIDSIYNQSLIGQLLHIGGMEFATAMLITSNDFGVCGLAQQYLGVFGGSEEKV